MKKILGFILTLALIWTVGSWTAAPRTGAEAASGEYKIQAFDNETGDYIIAGYNVMDYGAKADGKTDDSQAFQRALNDAGEKGGIVFVPAGTYLLSRGIKVPPRVELRGMWNHPITGDASLPETLLLAGVPSSDSYSQPLIEMQGNNMIKGFKIAYPDQSPEEIIPYAYTIEASNHVVEVCDVTLVNSYCGINFCREYGSAMVGRNLYLTVLKQGVRTDKNYEVTDFTDIHISSRYWKAYDPDLDVAKLREFTLTNCEAMIYGKADGVASYNIEIDPADYRNEFNLHVLEGAINTYGNMAWGTAIRLNGAKVNREIPQEIPPTFLEVDGIEGVEYYYDLYEFAEERFSGIAKLFNVKEYGAKGDGTTDDTEAVQSALAAAEENGGGVVFFPGGDYVIREKLVVAPNIELKGEWDGIRLASPSILNFYCGKGQESGANIELSENSGVHGLGIYYPEITVDDPGEVYAPSIMGMGKGVYVEYVNIYNGYVGVDFYTNRCDDFQILGLWANSASEIVRVGGGSENGRMEYIWFTWGAWGLKIPDKDDQDKAASYSSTHSTGIRFGDLKNLSGYSVGGFGTAYGVIFDRQTANGVENMLFIRMVLDIHNGTTAAQLKYGNNLVWVGYASGNGVGGARQLIVEDSFDGKARLYGFENWGGSSSFLNLDKDIEVYNVGSEDVEILKLPFLEKGMGSSLALILGICIPIGVLAIAAVIWVAVWRRKKQHD